MVDVNIDVQDSWVNLETNNMKRNLNLLHFTELNFNIKNVQNIRLKTFCLAIHFHFEVLQKQRYCNLLNKLTLSN